MVQKIDGPAVGIDLGTTYSCVGIWQNERVEIIANDQGNRTTPSWVAFTESERLIGDAAKNQAAMNPNNTIFDAKRLIGRKMDDPAIHQDLKHWPFKVIGKDGNKPHIQGEEIFPRLYKRECDFSACKCLRPYLRVTDQNLCSVVQSSSRARPKYSAPKRSHPWS